MDDFEKPGVRYNVRFVVTLLNIFRINRSHAVHQCAVLQAPVTLRSSFAVFNTYPF